MKLTTLFLLFVFLLVPTQPVSAERPDSNTVVLTAPQVQGAMDIEMAISVATANGTRPGTVILDGRSGPFVWSTDDRSLNIFVSDLVLRGTNNAVIEGCDDGLFFDYFPDEDVLEDILVEGITFHCSGDGVEASGAFWDVTLSDNVFQAGATGISVNGASNGWIVTNNMIQAGGDAIRMTGAERGVITQNQLSGQIGVALLGCSASQVRRNAIQASYQGVLVGQEAWRNKIQANTIMGVSASGLALEPGVTANQVVANRVLCAPGANCLTVDASPEVAELNTIAGNRP